MQRVKKGLFMDLLSYTPAHEAFRMRLREFCNTRVIPHVDEWEENHLVPKTVWREMGREGFLCTSVPREYGGLGGDFLYSVIALEEMAQTNHYGLDAFLHSDIVTPYIQTYGNSKQKEKYLPGCVNGDILTAIAMTEPGAGSDLSALTATAVETDGEVVINGSKTFISNGVSCDLVVVAAKNPVEENPYKAISLYLVEDGTPGFKKGTAFKKLGLHSQDTADLYFTNCLIPMENRLGDQGSGFVKLMEKLQQERLLVALLAVVKANFVLQWTLGYLKGGGGGKSGIEQAAKFSLVETATEIKLGRTFIDKLIMEHMGGENVATQTSMAKYWCTEMANRAANTCLDLCGDFGMTEECPITRTFRDIRVFPIFAGTNEIMKNIVAKQMGV
jgi:acyl-CoA dehydrogenase